MSDRGWKRLEEWGRGSPGQTGEDVNPPVGQGA